MNLLKVLCVVVVSVVCSLVCTKLYWDYYLKDSFALSSSVAVLDVPGYINENYKDLTKEGLRQALDVRVAELESQGFVVINKKYVLSSQGVYKVGK